MNLSLSVCYTNRRSKKDAKERLLTMHRGNNIAIPVCLLFPETEIQRYILEGSDRIFEIFVFRSW